MTLLQLLGDAAARTECHALSPGVALSYFAYSKHDTPVEIEGGICFLGGFGKKARIALVWDDPSLDKVPAGTRIFSPHDFKERSNHIYTTDTDCSGAVREWALENGDNPLYRITLCGYEGEHDMPDTWECVEWKAYGGYANLSNSRGKENAHRERLWFSKYCIKPSKKRQGVLLGLEVA